MAEIRLSSFSGRGLMFNAPIPFVMAGDETVRFNQLSYQFAGLSGLDGNTPAAELILQSLLALCSPWDKAGRTFLISYFRILKEQLAKDTALQELAQRFAGLYEWRDWLFSAPAALPRAHLYAPDFGPAKAVDETDFVQVAMAFRIKGRFVAILGEANAVTPKAARLRRSRLEAQGVTVLSAESQAAFDQPSTLIDAILAIEGPEFWRADPVPQGPFGPAHLAI